MNVYNDVTNIELVLFIAFVVEWVWFALMFNIKFINISINHTLTG